MTARVEPFEIDGVDGPERPIRGDTYIVDGARAAVVLAHGFNGFARWGFFPWLARAFNDAGLNAVTFEFSGNGIGSDRESFTEPGAFEENTFSKQLADLDIVWRAAEERGWLADRAGLFGFSRGGGVTILATSRNQGVRALVTWSSISTISRCSDDVLVEWRRRGYEEVENARTKQRARLGMGLLDEIEHRSGPGMDLNILDAASTITVPWLIVHGTADATVPVHEGRQLHTASNNRAELAIVEGATHTFGATHPFGDASPELIGVTHRTIRFFTANLL